MKKFVPSVGDFHICIVKLSKSLYNIDYLLTFPNVKVAVKSLSDKGFVNISQ